MNYNDLEDLRKKALDPISVSEYHGNICSYICCNISSFEDLLPKEKSNDENISSFQIIEFRDALSTLIKKTTEDFKTNELSISLLIPNDDEPLKDRAIALSLWSQGFIDGLGMIITENAGSLEESSMSLLTEIIEDFSQISTLTFNSIVDEEEEELAFVELVEYVRVSTQLIFEEITI